ncbi:Six-hairpin glycosidase-like protein [Irpex lacteus]|nr:Six-hairpin glycosidase-like protein [Irpex lacteus]
MNVLEPSKDRGYLSIGDHGLYVFLVCLILVRELLRPNFDSPSIFARISTKIKAVISHPPSSNVLQTKCVYERPGVVTVTDFLPRQPSSATARPLLSWLVRRVDPLHLPQANLTLDLRYVPESTLEAVPVPHIPLSTLDLSEKGHLGESVCSEFELSEGQVVTWVLRTPPEHTNYTDAVRPSRAKAEALGVPAADDPILTKSLMRELLDSTNAYWNSWIRRSTYQGSWKEAVNRSALALKLLIYEPTGAVVASPTFSLPEYIGGTRNCVVDPRLVFTLYALIRLGFTYEANAYMDFIFERVKDKNADGSLNIMYTIHGEKLFPEEELSHLDGHKGSKPVRIGNGAIDHVQLDIYGELMDCIYLGQKYGKPLVHVVKVKGDPDLSIWSVRGSPHHTFTNSSFTHRLRLADKRSFPCPRRLEWLKARDELYEEIMEKAWNPELQIFGQAYEDKDVLDSSLMIMPLVFFSTPSDPRFLGTLKKVLLTPERGGLTSNGLVYRYDVAKSDDGVGGEEGTFCLCTLWTVEALARAGEYDKPLFRKAVAMFEDFLQYTNHVGLCTEEISPAGDGLGNAVQGFTHVTLISAAYNLSRMQAKYH